ncbi:MAG: L,D-transpeptidase family protein [Hyphomicrobiales bacterium]
MRRVLFIAFAFFVLALPAVAIWVIRGSFDMTDTIESRRATLDTRLSEQGLRFGKPVFIRIFKETSELEVWMQKGNQWSLFQNYPICKYSGQLGPKLKQGDHQAPEGFYKVSKASLNPNSRWHLSFNLGFPNAYDRAHGRTGSFLMVHGGCSSIGCYAMTNPAVDDIYRLTEAALVGGQNHVPVHIFPFRMDEAKLRAHDTNKWHGFWRMLKRGYDAFEQTGQPPEVRVAGKQYVIGEQFGFLPNMGGKETMVNKIVTGSRITLTP